jgi:DNA-binding IscR family transcriptional regulator
VLRCIHGQVFDSPALNEPQCPPELRKAWLTLQDNLTQTAQAITFQRLVEESSGKEKMYYI